MRIIYRHFAPMVDRQGYPREGQTVEETGEGAFEWAGDACRFTGTRVIKDTVSESAGPFEIVMSAERKMWLDRVDDHVTIVSAVAYRPRERHDFRPLHWYREPRVWLQSLGGENGRTFFPSAESIKVSRDGDEVTVAISCRYEDDMTWVVTVVASLAADGNVVSYDSTVPKGHRHHGRYEWVRDGKGRIILKSWTGFHTNAATGAEATTEWTVSDCDLDHRPPARRFTVAGMEPAPGTVVDDRVAGRTYTWGRADPDATTEKKLRQLAERLRQGGFGDDGEP